MVNSRILLSGLWVAVMLTYLLGDVLRIFSGDAESGVFQDMQVTQGMWLLIAVIMLVPILMVVLNLILPLPRYPLGQHRCRHPGHSLQHRRPALPGHV